MNYIQPPPNNSMFQAHWVGWRCIFPYNSIKPTSLSEPTGWDGDKSAGLGKTRTGILRLVLNPLCGMATTERLLLP